MQEMLQDLLHIAGLAHHFQSACQPIDCVLVSMPSDDVAVGLDLGSAFLLETSFDDPSIHRLSVAEHIAQLHGGRVTALNCPEGGAAFTLQFPVPTSAKAAA